MLMILLHKMLTVYRRLRLFLPVVTTACHSISDEPTRYDMASCIAFTATKAGKVLLSGPARLNTSGCSFIMSLLRSRCQSLGLGNLALFEVAAALTPSTPRICVAALSFNAVSLGFGALLALFEVKYARPEALIFCVFLSLDPETGSSFSPSPY